MPVRFTLSPPNASRAIARTAAALLTVALLTACAADRTGPTGLNPGLDASRNGLPFAGGLASPVWQQTARDYVSAAMFIPVAGGHAYPILGVAQYLAVQRAEASVGNGNLETANPSGNDAGGRRRLETVRGAVAGASVVTLSYLFPSRVQELENMVTAQANAGPGQPHPAFAAGEAIGRAVGAEIVTRAKTDGFTNSYRTDNIPVCPGCWTSNTTPPTINGGQLPGVLPWFLTSASQFLLQIGPPPAFGSAAFNTALAEIRHISDTRTQQQIDIAAFWALGAGTPTAAGFWLQVASDEIASHGLSEREATHLFALLGATMADAQIACWDAKLTYWLIRPWKADPAITTTAAVGKPNHPSYYSGHSCVSSSAGEVLSTFFPERRAHFEAMVEEAGLSRMYGGIHYRFDITAGRDLGLHVAAFAIAADASGHSILTAH